jgi:hypothetical protein
MTVDPTDEQPPPDTGVADEETETGDEPADDSFLMGATGVQTQVEAEVARAEADLAGEAPDADDDGAVV